MDTWDDDDQHDGWDGEGERHCFHCAGTGYTECSDPIECMKPHLGGQRGFNDGDVCPCSSCGGSGLAKDMTIW